MRTLCLAAIAAIVSLPLLGQGLVGIQEDKIHAFLHRDLTAVSVAISNPLNHPVRAELRLAWVDDEENVSPAAVRQLVIPPGGIQVEADCPLPSSSIFTRLRYALTPESQSEVRGTVALANIATHVFELHVSQPEVVRPGSPITLHAQAVHPVTRQPLTDVTWTATLTINRKEYSPRSRSKQNGGFNDFTFDIPATVGEHGDDLSVQVVAQKGDFKQDVDMDLPAPIRLSSTLQTDKPIYQPGQSLHFRAVLTDARKRPAAGAQVELQIEDEENDRVHTITLTSSKNGVVKDDWEIPASATLGTYQIRLGSEGAAIGFHAIRVSRYELPSFRVTAKPDRAAYVPGQSAQVKVTGEYLFGKPVPNGTVKIYRDGGNYSRKRSRIERQELITSGQAGADGAFTARIDLTKDYEDIKESTYRRYMDVGFAAYYTDPGSGRTEQMRFDMRVSRQPVHVYLISSGQGGSLPAAAYVTTSYADGRPAAATVQVAFADTAVQVRTNAQGLAKVMLPSGDFDGEMKVRAITNDGQSGNWADRYWRPGVQLLHLEIDRTIRRSGEAVTLRLQAPSNGPASQSVMIFAMAGDQVVATRIVKLVNYRGQVTFPYQPEFRRNIDFVAWGGVDATADNRYKVYGSRTLFFPDHSDLAVTLSSDKSQYKPGVNATLRAKVTDAAGKPVPAVLGLAMVDQAVLERARTDASFGTSHWLRCNYCINDDDARVGDVRLRDLFQRKEDARITPELDLAAEILALNGRRLVFKETSESIADPPRYTLIREQEERLKVIIDERYLGTSEFPRDIEGLARILGDDWEGLRDPWDMRYEPHFGIEGSAYEVTLTSAGPDKRFGTLDDFEAITVRGDFSSPWRERVQLALRAKRDYPGDEAAFLSIVNDKETGFSEARDPWGHPYFARIATRQAQRFISIHSAGPDGLADTVDDRHVAGFIGPYFEIARDQILSALQATKPVRSAEEFEAVLAAAGHPIASLLDAWGQPYHLVSGVTAHYVDRIRSYTERVGNGEPVQKSEVIPVTQRLLNFTLRSAGEDRLLNTPDDFNITTFPVVVEESAADPGKTPFGDIPADQVGGNLVGTVTDATGAVIANASVQLTNGSLQVLEVQTGADGRFAFLQLPPGTYTLEAQSPGFRHFIHVQVAVEGGKTLVSNITLEVGQATETITVTSEAVALQTSTAEVSSAPALPLSTVQKDGFTTPRVRDYFPETLVWLPEWETNSAGNAMHRFRLADSIGTWKIAAFASTADGRTAEGETELRTFQPFFLDLNPPLVLTEGDRLVMPVTVRNYGKDSATVTVELQSNEAATIQESRKTADIEAGASRNVTFDVRAARSSDQAEMRATALTSGKGDAIARTFQVHPDGQETRQTFGDLFTGSATFGVQIPKNAIASGTRAELRIYPNLASMLLESASALFETPHGCAEQTISLGYSNLIAWRFAKAAGISNTRLEQLALANVHLAMESLQRFSGYDGGVSYWHSGSQDIAVTAYALQFLAETGASRDKLGDKVAWLKRHQSPDGRWLALDWNGAVDERRSLTLTASVLRSLGAALKASVNVAPAVWEPALAHIATAANSVDEPYMLANYILAALDTGTGDRLGAAATRLAGLAHSERDGAYWDLQTNSPFYGWGVTGRNETTALVVSALVAWRSAHANDAQLDAAIRRGLLYLLRHRGADGYWGSTQATARALRGIVDAAPLLGALSGPGGSMTVELNGRVVATVPLPANTQATDPIRLNVAPYLVSGDNEFVLRAAGAQIALVRLAETHWTPWMASTPRHSPDLRLTVAYSKLEAAVAEPVRVSVNAERVGFRGYGMMLAEIGLPPAVEVDRASLEDALDDESAYLDHYEVLPDRVILYLWPKAGGAKIDFFVSPRTAMAAMTAASSLYDYNNPDARAEVPPVLLRVASPER